MNITILFGTESGTSEFAAIDLAEAIDTPVEVVDLADHPANGFDVDTLYLVVCSTYGDGELPASARPFHAALLEQDPDLTGVRYAMFGLGDSSYEETYSQGSEIIDRALAERGAQRVGDYGRHDASGLDIASDAAIAWFETLRDEVLLADVAR